jgi:predicted membrane-bound spermidine synthase
VVRGIALLLTVLTGFSGLVYQVAWQKYMAVLLGSHAEATATVLGIFLGGLSLGYALFGTISRRLMESARGTARTAPLLRTYGWVEAGIGVYALVFPMLFGLMQMLSLWLPHSGENGGDALAFAADVGLTVILIGPPTVLMGGTIPLLTQGLARDLDDATRFHSFVYAFNTAGAFSGAIAAGFFLVPWLGLDGSVLAMGIVNLAAGLIFLLLGTRAAPATAHAAPAPPLGTKAPTRLALYATVATLSGFAMMTLQTALNRIGALSLGASHFTFAMVVAIFVASISLGSFAVSALPRIRSSYLIGSQWLLVSILIAGYVFVQDAPYWAHVARIRFGIDDAAFHAFHLSVFLHGFALLVVPIGLSGATLPLLFHHLRSQVGHLGEVAGRLYAWNTVGSLIGALLGGYALLFWLDLHHTYRLATAALAVGAALLTLQVARRGKLWGVAALGVAVLTLMLLPPWAPEKLAPGLYRYKTERPFSGSGPNGYLADAWGLREIVFYDDDPTTTVTVTQAGRATKAVAIYNNGKSDGQIPADNLTMGLAALLPALLTPTPERAFVIGYGTGYTVGALAAIESIEQIRVAEISPAVVEAAAFFEPYNAGAAADPKTSIRRSDAYRALLRSSARYDVIVSEPSNPWMAGVEMLYSLEFLEAARSRLTEQGIYVQWFHLYQMDDATLELVLDTYLAAFERVAVWFSLRKDLLILGFNDADQEIDVSTLVERFHRTDFAAAFAELGIETFGALMAHELLPRGVLRDERAPPRVHRILHPILSHYAARAFFKGGTAVLPRATRPAAIEVGARTSLARRYLESLPEEARIAALEQMAREACRQGERHCLTLLAGWSRAAPGSPELASTLAGLRSQGRDAAESLSEGNLRLISQLFGEAGISKLPPNYAGASRVRALFERFYYHGVPFDPGALRGAWRRCSSDPRCAEELR